MNHFPLVAALLAGFSCAQNEPAGWNAIAEVSNRAPSTWTEAREALGLSVRQAVWSCGSKLLLWHWAQPLSYFALLGIYYCTLPDDKLFFGQLVAVREAVYVLSTLLALRGQGDSGLGFENAMITGIKYVVKQGLYNPYTTIGDLVVFAPDSRKTSGVLASAMRAVATGTPPAIIPATARDR